MEYQGTFLPHIQPKYAQYFITFTLSNSTILKYFHEIKYKRELKLKNYKNNNSEKTTIYRTNINKKYFDMFDNFLNTFDSKENYLSDTKCSDIIVNKLKEYHSKYYNLLAYCIMPNHVHILIDTAIQTENDNFVPIGKIMKLIKGGTSREINIILKRKGTLWLRDYYDHYIRTQKEFTNIVNYIKLNPVKSGLVNDWEKWKYTFVSKYC